MAHQHTNGVEIYVLWQGFLFKGWGGRGWRQRLWQQRSTCADVFVGLQGFSEQLVKFGDTSTCGSLVMLAMPNDG
jgi:hypothetical protein